MSFNPSSDPTLSQATFHSASNVVKNSTDWLFREDKTHVLTRKVFFSLPFDLFMGFIVVLNVWFVIIEVDAVATGQEIDGFYSVVNRLFVCIYLSELLLRFFLVRLTMFYDTFTWLDCFVVTIDMFNMVFMSEGSFKNSSIVRIFRLAKLARTVHLMKKAPELHLMLKGIVGACKSILYGSILACTVILFWSILAVEIIQPTNDVVTQSGFYDTWACNRCANAYRTVWDSFHTFIRTCICGDSWGTFTEPIIQEAPITMFFFMMVYSSINFVVLNMILAVIIDAAQEARSLSVQELAEEKEKYFHKAQKRLMELCGKIDKDGSGTLTMSELESAFGTDLEFSNILRALGVKVNDMPIVFSVMDSDDSGTVSYQEFVQQLYTMQKNDTQSMIMHLRFYVQQILRSVKVQLDKLDVKLSDKIEEDERALENKFNDVRMSLTRVVVDEAKLVENETQYIQKMSSLLQENLKATSASSDKLYSGSAASISSASDKLTSPLDYSRLCSRDEAELCEQGSSSMQDLSRKLDAVHTSILRLFARFETLACEGNLGRIALVEDSRFSRRLSNTLQQARKGMVRI